MAKSKRYVLDGIEHHVPPMCVAQEEGIAEILGEAGLVDVAAKFITAESEEEEIELDQVLLNLGRKKLIRRFLAICLVPVNQEFDETQVPERERLCAKMSADEVMEVIRDFFGANEKLWKRLSGIFLSLLPEKKSDEIPVPMPQMDGKN